MAERMLSEIDEIKRKRQEVNRIEAAFDEDIDSIIQELVCRFREGYYLCELNQRLENEEITETEYKNIFNEKITLDIYGTFLYEKLFLYPQTDETKQGILFGIKKRHYLFNFPDGENYYEDLQNKVCQYINSFKKPDLDENDNRDAQILKILNLGIGNYYADRLYGIWLYSLFENLSESEEYLLVNDILNKYYFDVVVPSEDDAIREKRAEQQRFLNLINSDRNSVPNLTYIYEGKKYHGASVANMIKDVGWKPKPAGTNSRKAQERRLKQFMDWYTQKLDNNNSITEILAVYDSMIEKDRKKIYEPLIEILLLNALYHAEDETIYTTRNKFFQSLNVFSPNFQSVPVQYYIDTVPEKYVEDVSDISVTRDAFRDSVNDKLKKLIFPTLNSLQARKKIRYSSNTIIVISGIERINVNELNTKDVIKMDKKILEAQEFAIEHTYYYDGRRKVYCKNWEEIIRHKKSGQYKRLYEDYIADNFGWSYTYEEIQITAGTKRSIEKSIYETEKKLRELLIQYFRKNALIKYQNRDKKWKAAYQAFLNEITEKTGLDESSYQNEIEKMKAKIRPFPKYFTDIFNVMIATEIDCNPEIEKQIRQWRKTKSDGLKEIDEKKENQQINVE
ncbi:MAG: hypothetical protein HFG28_09485 [Eubacterium sp.]|nr:hypothetical protein [Eubacterium sp.]